MRTTPAAALALSLAAWPLAAPAAPLSPAHCDRSVFTGHNPDAASTSLHGKTVKFSKIPCSDPIFFNAGTSDSPSGSSKARRVCLGFKEQIDQKLKTSGDYCRRLSSNAWTENLNIRFLQCAAAGAYGAPVWLTTSASAARQRPTHPDLYKTVTFAEMCYWHQQLAKPFP